MNAKNLSEAIKNWEEAERELQKHMGQFSYETKRAVWNAMDAVSEYNFFNAKDMAIIP